MPEESLRNSAFLFPRLTLLPRMLLGGEGPGEVGGAGDSFRFLIRGGVFVIESPAAHAERTDVAIGLRVAG